MRSLTQVECVRRTSGWCGCRNLLVNGVPRRYQLLAANQFVFSFPQPPTGTVTFALRRHGIQDQASFPRIRGDS